MLINMQRRLRFSELGEKEILALAISAEEEDSQIYSTYAERLKDEFPQTAAMFAAMGKEEDGHRRLLIDHFRAAFGDTIPLIRREHVAGFMRRRPVWLVANLSLDRIRSEAAAMEEEARNFYQKAAARTAHAETRKLLGDLAVAEGHHIATAERLEAEYLPAEARSEEDRAAHRRFVLTYVQPGLAGLMDGSVSTLAPIFAAAFATHDTSQTFLVGLAAAIGAGISMGFTEAASDDGALTGRGSPLKRGISSGVMTALGGLGHALPYLIPHFWTATAIAFVIVIAELWAIAWIQQRWMDTPFWRAALQVILGGSLVFAAGILIGNA
ncbi:rubrerythrin [Rhodopseudomonas julia]|uniref:Rubrerythrin n=1 Tax=Rhodopseudomonas julia TaxID=200617 RepID=A0ABU0C419_9BRAD|nr:ferritin family protein [Rhodopseudomonas julia]MDQ0325256.1 rubrerythrin [Rhodopseudomonas julia]